MATKQEKEKLMATLKFTPRTYQVSVYGYGGEIAMGKIDPKTFDYFKSKGVDVGQYATQWDDGDEDHVDVPEELRPFESGSWYECDNIEHCSGAEFGGATIQVTDENNVVVWETDLGYNLEDDGCELSCFSTDNVDDFEPGTCIFVGQSFEKGTFFDGELALTAPFDPAKFKFTYSEVNEWSILNYIEYDGEELDGTDGYSTTGKSSDFRFYRVHDDNEIELYMHSEADNSEDAIPPMPELPLTDWFPGDIVPARKGMYEVIVGPVAAWPFPNQAHYTWTGKYWKNIDGEKVQVQQWRGLAIDPGELA